MIVRLTNTRGAPQKTMMKMIQSKINVIDLCDSSDVGLVSYQPATDFSPTSHILTNTHDNSSKPINLTEEPFSNTSSMMCQF